MSTKHHVTFDPEDSYYSPKDVARRFNVSYRTVLDWIHEDELEAYQLAGKLYRIPPSALDVFARPVRESRSSAKATYRSTRGALRANRRPIQSSEEGA